MTTDVPSTTQCPWMGTPALEGVALWWALCPSAASTSTPRPIPLRSHLVLWSCSVSLVLSDRLRQVLPHPYNEGPVFLTAPHTVPHMSFGAEARC